MTLSGFEPTTFRLIAQPTHAVECNIYRNLQFLQGSRKAYLRVVGETDLTYPYSRAFSEKRAVYTDSLRAAFRSVPVFTFEDNCVFGI
jgi:hypothetical protein